LATAFNSPDVRSVHSCEFGQFFLGQITLEPQATDEPFVSKVTGNKVRVWKTPPPRSKASSRCYPYFRGEVREVNGERHLVGSFALHPFHIVLTSIPIALAGLTLWLVGKTVWGVVFIAALAAFEFITLASLRRDRPLEEKRIVVFLDALFVEQGKVQSPD